jgi:hypothetical protein
MVLFYLAADESIDSAADDSQESSMLDDSTAQEETPTKNEQVSKRHSQVFLFFFLKDYVIYLM